MSGTTKIQWAQMTWNPVAGCTEAGPGCDHCYARQLVEMRMKFAKGTHYYQIGFRPHTVPHVLPDPLTWLTPKYVFVNSMSDLFHPEFNDDYITDIVKVMHRASWHTFQLLTKRPARMVRMLNGPLAFAAQDKHLWWGTSVENRQHGLARAEALRQAPVPNWFLSIEPLLEDLGDVDLAGVHWVIVGGESGKDPRPMDPAWAESIRQQCVRAKIPFFFKQMGGSGRDTDGDTLYGRTYLAMPQLSSNPVMDRRERLAHVGALRAKYAVKGAKVTDDGQAGSPARAGIGPRHPGGATAQELLADTFCGARYGQVLDPYGHKCQSTRHEDREGADARLKPDLRVPEGIMGRPTFRCESRSILGLAQHR